jgi:integrase/recombinase XerD
MRFNDAVDLFLRDRKVQGRHTKNGTTTRTYRWALGALADEVQNRDPRLVGRQDIKRTLARWEHPNTVLLAMAAYGQFFDYLIEEDYCKTNPVSGITRPRRRKPTKLRLTSTEVEQMLTAAMGVQEKRAIHLGILAGLRNSELRGLTGRHFHRPDFIDVSSDIAKNSDARWVPIIEELRPVVAEILETCQADEFVLKSNRAGRQMSSSGLQRLVRRVAERAGISQAVTPHTLRHAFADSVARQTGPLIAQSMLGHKSLATTQVYLGETTLEELAAAVARVSFGLRRTGGPSALALAGSAHNADWSHPVTAERFGALLVGLRAGFRPLIGTGL